MIVFGLLIVEYRYFKRQAEKISALQIEYKNYVLAVRRLLRGSNFVKEQTSQELTSADEKKNSDETGNPLIVNRNPDHVKESSIAFFKRRRMENILSRIAATEWLDYTEQALAEREQAKQPTKKIARAHRARRNSRAMRRRFAMRAKKPITPMTLTHNSSKIFSWPIDPSRFWLSSLFGPRKNPSGWRTHQGIDMAAIKGTPVKAAAPGEITEAGWDEHGRGKMILVAHGNQYQTRYAHLDKILVSAGQHVERGTIIGRVGATGNVRGRHSGSHLHFEVLTARHTVNPLHFLGLGRIEIEKFIKYFFVVHFDIL